MPQPQQVRDIRTGYGIVRVYRFAGARDDRAPLLLLPGRAAPTPVWADNLPSFLALRSVYTVDLLGEPGLSVQDRPLATDDDQAAWLAEVGSSAVSGSPATRTRSSAPSSQVPMRIA